MPWLPELLRKDVYKRQECSGSPTAFNDMVNHMYNGGKISLLGILPKQTQINWNNVIFKGLTLKGIYGREMYETWYHMEKMLISGLDISQVITCLLYTSRCV